MKYFISFSYDGSNFNGFQRQEGIRTVQGEIERVLTKINDNEKVSIHGAGRTDAQVHAISQKAHFTMKKDMEVDKLKKAINSLISNDIYITSCDVVEDDFHARYNATGKEYIYKINMGQYNPVDRNYIYQYNKRLDVVEIERAIKYLEGEHDFSSFTKKEDSNKNCVRKIVQTCIIRDVKNVNILTLSFVGDGFLRYQVRNMVGILIEIGENKRKSEDIMTILKAKDRTKAGLTAPACGLYLKNVFY